MRKSLQDLIAEVQYNANPKECTELVELAADIRELIFADANDMMQGAMAGSPAECLFFAKLWIQRAKGTEPDRPELFR
jgi:Mg2+/Co2+ transporter CorC